MQHATDWTVTGHVFGTIFDLSEWCQEIIYVYLCNGKVYVQSWLTLKKRPEFVCSLITHISWFHVSLLFLLMPEEGCDIHV